MSVGWRGWLTRLALCAALAVITAGAVAVVHVTYVAVPARGMPQAPGVPATAVAAPPEAPPAALQQAPSDVPAARPSPIDRVDGAWVDRISAATGIPPRALVAYASADLTIDAEQPACGIGWNTLAGIGRIESEHGSYGGAVLGEDGYPRPAIRGIPLNGDGVAAIADTDAGAWDGDVVWDRAVGPMQFIPETWSHWGADGNGDGAADPNQIDDAALAAARYLCASGSMTDVEGWRAAVFSYNHLEVYVDDVAAVANAYASAADSAG